MRTTAAIAAGLALLLSMAALAVSVLRAAPPAGDPQGDAMSGMGMGSDVTVPPVKGYVDGQPMLFIHTETSDEQVAGMLTQMMGGSPVLVVPSLAEVAERGAAPAYVFQNGVKGDGPLGFQPDVFDGAPGSPRYTPLRRVHLVRWKDETQARELTSATDVVAQEQRGLLTVERTRIVVNMPFLVWPGGRR